jgi:GTPase involved in cell partitioning and DNA repair
MKYIIYRTTNILNGKIYIGKHQTKDINDGYLGSGIALEKAIKKYGKESFKKEVLFIFNTEDEMNEKEKELVTESFIASNSNYNMGVGGEGGSHFKGKSHSEKTKKLLSSIAKNQRHSEETRKKISEANRKRVLSEETKKKLSEKAKLRFSDEKSKKNHSDTMKKYYREVEQR